MKKILLFAQSLASEFPAIHRELETEGFEVRMEQHYPENVSGLIDSFHPDMVIAEASDHSRNHRDALYKSLRMHQDHNIESIPVLLIGAKRQQGLLHHAPGLLHGLLQELEAGAHDYLCSPFEIPELVGKINATLRLKASIEKSKELAQQLNQLNDELYQRNVQVEKELYIARQLQQSLLPKPLQEPAGDDFPLFTKVHFHDEKVRVSGIYLPCDALGGDLYDVIRFKDNSLGITISDVSGHGVPAGFITAMYKTSLHRISHEHDTPSAILYHLNNDMYDVVKTGDFITAIYSHLDMTTMKYTCSGAGHPYPFVYKAKDQSFYRIEKNGTPLIWVQNMDFPQETVQLEPGDKVFLFTDGISELNNTRGEMYGEERIEQVLLEGILNQDRYLTDTIITALSDFTEGAPLADDISMVLIEIK
jgi:phosphoserine phosphatase RsbU/P